MHIQENVSLKPYNTFGIDEYAENYVVLDDEAILHELTGIKADRHILGGGSNILLQQPLKGLVIHNKLKGITIEKQDDDYVWLNVKAGEIWHDLVLYALEHNVAGIENLALIPGTVGASPIQNIGAYGVEAKETIDSVTAWHWDEKKFITYTNTDCRFGYRDSIFKQELKNKVLITAVTFKLSNKPNYNISYGAITQELERMKVFDLSIKAVADAVMNIRRSKLPDPKVTGNAGSFFKNPAIPVTQFEALKNENPLMPSYPVDAVTVKIPAGWLIEQCGWKGYKKGNTGVHEKQALVLVNYGAAKGNEIWELSNEIIQSVKEKFGIDLEREVQVW